MATSKKLMMYGVMDVRIAPRVRVRVRVRVGVRVGVRVRIRVRVRVRSPPYPDRAHPRRPPTSPADSR